jgi:predicted flap endonuclease-1-like 5' DNA nuclease
MLEVGPVGSPHLIAATLLLLAAFLVGCLLGHGLRMALPFASPRQRALAQIRPGRRTAARSLADLVPANPPTVEPPPAAPAPKSPGRVRPVLTRPGTSQASLPPSDLGVAPAMLSGPRAGGKDDLKKISGIGETLESILNAMGIFHYDQIAAWSEANIVWVDAELAFKGRIAREKWVSQARALAPKKPRVRRKPAVKPAPQG